MFANLTTGHDAISRSLTIIVMETLIKTVFGYEECPILEEDMDKILPSGVGTIELLFCLPQQFSLLTALRILPRVFDNNGRSRSPRVVTYKLNPRPGGSGCRNAAFSPANKPIVENTEIIPIQKTISQIPSPAVLNCMNFPKRG